MPGTSIATNPDLVMENATVAQAMSDMAGEDDALYGDLQSRAVEAVQVANELSAAAGKELTDGALVGIAVAAVRAIDPEADPLALHHTIVSWLGPANVPDNLRFSWEPPHRRQQRKPALEAPAAAIPEITAERGAELLAAQNTMAVADEAVMDVAELYKALGRIEATEFFRKISDVVAAQTFTEIRTGKKYKGLPYRGPDGITRRVGDFEEFCRVFLGKSYNRCLELANNLHTLGADLYESAERVGFKARDYQALKALPQDEQDIVKQALAADSKDQVLDILQDLAARHQSERAAAKKQAEDMKGDLDARDTLLAEKSEKLDKVSLDLAKLKALPPNEREVLRLEQEQEAAKQLTTAVIEAQVAINALLAQLAAIKAAEVSAYTKDHADQTASWFCQQVQFSLQENGIQADMAEIALPEWMRDTAQASPVDQEGR